MQAHMDSGRRFGIGVFAAANDEFLGVVIGDRVTPIRDLGIAELSSVSSLRDLLENWQPNFALLNKAVDADRISKGVPLDALAARAPLPNPRQLFCCGANYPEHVIQMMLATNANPGLQGLDAAGRRAFAEAFVARQARESDPYVFMKTVTSICGPSDIIELPEFSDQVDWELELAVVFGRTAYRETRETAMSAVAGYMVVNDMTARDKVRRTDPGSIGADWVAGKGSPGFLPSGPWFVPAAFVPNPHELRMLLSVNGEVMQDASTGEMTFNIPRQIEFLTRFARLLPGDILCTGTPDGNAVATGRFLRDGDVIEAAIEGLGAQKTHCRRRAAQ